MADLALTTAGRIEVMDSDVDRQLHLSAGADITAGQPITPDANGRFVLADADAAGLFGNVYMAGKTVKAGQGVTGFKKARVDGFNLSALAIGALVYLSNTAGAWADAAGTNSVVGGRVIPGPASPKGGTVDKLLQLDLPA